MMPSQMLFRRFLQCWIFFLCITISEVVWNSPENGFSSAIFAQEIAQDTIVETDIGPEASDKPAGERTTIHQVRLTPYETQLLGALAALKDAIPRVQAEALYKLLEIEALERIPAEQFPRIVELLHSDDPWVRTAAVKTVSQRKDISQRYLPQLNELLHHEQPGVRAAAAKTLSALDQQGEAYLAQLRSFLKSSDQEVRAAAATALGKQGERAKETIPEIAAMLTSPDWDIRSAAAQSLGDFGPVARGAVPKIVTLLTHQDWDIRSTAATALGNLGEVVKEFVPQIEDLLGNSSWETRTAAAMTLGKLRHVAEGSVPKLVARLQDESWSVRAASARALGEIGEPSAPYISQIQRLLQDEEKNVRAAAAWALGNLGTASSASIPAIGARLEDQEAMARSAAVEALGKLGEPAASYIPQITTMITDNDWEVRSAAAKTLSNFGDKASASLPQIITLADDQDWYVRASTARALGELGAIAAQVLPQLVKLLHDQNGNVRSAAVSSIGKFGAASKPYAPEILPLLHDQHPGARYFAIKTLGNLGEMELTSISSMLAPIYADASQTAELRFLAHLAGAGKENIETLLQWIGRPGSNYPDPESLTYREAKHTLETFEQAWDSTESLPDVRADLAEQIAVVAQTQAEQNEWTHKDLPLLEPLWNHLRQIGSIHANVLQQILKDVYLKTFAQFLDSLDLESRKAEWLQTFEQYQRRQLWKRRGLLVGGIGLAHLIVWSVLLLLYPFSRTLQRSIVWNAPIRRALGLGYINWTLVHLPFLRQRLFTPFRHLLQAEAVLDRIDDTAYFAQCQVLQKSDVSIRNVHTAIPRFTGKIILEGKAGSGKTIFAWRLMKSSHRVSAYFRALSCPDGILQRIQHLLSDVTQDVKFLRKLVRYGAIDLCLDDLHELPPTARANHLHFLQYEFKGHALVLTQPLEWIGSTSSMQRYVLQPLAPAQIADFLVSCYTLLPESLRSEIPRAEYESACRDYIADILDPEQPFERGYDNYQLLSNPFNLSMIAFLGAFGKAPNLQRLLHQYYDVMAETYTQAHQGVPFPFHQISEDVAWMHHHATLVFPPNTQWTAELDWMARFLMVVRIEKVDLEGRSSMAWVFRHKKIMDFFVT